MIATDYEQFTDEELREWAERLRAADYLGLWAERNLAAVECEARLRNLKL
jgi:hypothetical protein